MEFISPSTVDDNGAALWRNFANFMERRLDQVPKLARELQPGNGAAANAAPLDHVRVERDTSLWGPAR